MKDDRITLRALMALGSDIRVEVIEGVMVDKPAEGMLHQVVMQNIFRRFDAYSRPLPDVEAMYDGPLYLFDLRSETVENALSPDVSIFRVPDMPLGWKLSDPIPCVPALVVEIISHNDSVEQTRLRLRTYLEAGTEQVWVVYPEEQELHQFVRGETEVRVYQSDGLIDTGTLFPGFALQHSDVFKLPRWATANPFAPTE
jgi:Uma2 family endonuclease